MSTKRKLSSSGSDYEELISSEGKRTKTAPSPSTSRAVPGSNDKIKKKAERMERNRQAAQASRDRKKVYTEEVSFPHCRSTARQLIAYCVE